MEKAVIALSLIFPKSRILVRPSWSNQPTSKAGTDRSYRGTFVVNLFHRLDSIVAYLIDFITQWADSSVGRAQPLQGYLGLYSLPKLYLSISI
jgi:hypothetical protein